MSTVISNDGTVIAYDRLGDGPPLILVCGGSVDRQSNAQLATLLANRFTVYNYDRRGRGDSGDTTPYAIEREFDDIAALIDVAGGSAGLYGSSSGAALALHATASGLPITRLALWEPPFILEGSRPRPPKNTAKIYSDLVAEGRRGDAVEYFMATVVGLPPEFVAYARGEPWWPAQEAIAHTLAYDATIMDDYSMPTDVARRVSTPTLVLAGGASFPWMAETAQTLANLLADGHYHLLDGQQHNVDAMVLAPVLSEFFAG